MRSREREPVDAFPPPVQVTTLAKGPGREEWITDRPRAAGAWKRRTRTRRGRSARPIAVPSSLTLPGADKHIEQVHRRGIREDRGWPRPRAGPRRLVTSLQTVQATLLAYRARRALTIKTMRDIEEGKAWSQRLAKVRIRLRELQLGPAKRGPVAERSKRIHARYKLSGSHCCHRAQTTRTGSKLREHLWWVVQGLNL